MPYYFLSMKPDTSGSYEIHTKSCKLLPKQESRYDLDLQISAQDALTFAKMRFANKRDHIKLCRMCCREEPV